MNPKLMRLIKKVDLAVERADYGGAAEDLALCNLMTNVWPEMEKALLDAAKYMLSSPLTDRAEREELSNGR